MRFTAGKVLKKSLGATVLCIGFLVGFSDFSIKTVRSLLSHSVQKDVACENQQISGSLVLLYNVPKVYADATAAIGSGSGSGSEGEGCGCCGCGGGCACGCCGCGGGD